jgi:hypothetical protein
MQDEKTRNREIRSLAKAMKELEVERATVVTEDTKKEEKLNGKTISVVPLWKFLLLE